jgi:hypothetical protein
MIFSQELKLNKKINLIPILITLFQISVPPSFGNFTRTALFTKKMTVFFLRSMKTKVTMAFSVQNSFRSLDEEILIIILKIYNRR